MGLDASLLSEDVAGLVLVRIHMEFRPGSPADAEAIAGLIANFQGELTDDPSGAVRSSILRPCPYRPSASI